MKLGVAVCALVLSLAPGAVRAQVATVSGKSETLGISVTGIGAVPAEFDRHVLRVELFVKMQLLTVKDTPAAINQRAETALAARSKDLTAALAPFGIKPGPEGTYLLPDGPFDGQNFGKATRAQFLAAIRKISPESTPTVESSMSSALLKRLQKACLVEAVKNARDQAETLAGLLDIKLGKILSASSGQVAMSNTIQRTFQIDAGPSKLPAPMPIHTYIMISYAFEPNEGK